MTLRFLQDFPGGPVVKNLPANAGHKDSISGWSLKTKITASGPITSPPIDGEIMETVRDFWGEAPKSLQMVTAAMKLKDTCSLEENL